MTGSEVPGKPSLGSWLAYGLGSESNDLPAFVVLTPHWKSGAAAQALFTRMWSQRFSGQRSTRESCCGMWATRCSTCRTRQESDAANRRAMLDALGELNHLSAATLSPIRKRRPASRSTRWRSACRRACRNLTDIQSESQETLDMYGPDVSKPGTFAASALLARRLVERGVRVVQILHRGWDQHGNLPRDLRIPVRRHRSADRARCSRT